MSIKQEISLSHGPQENADMQIVAKFLNEIRSADENEVYKLLCSLVANFHGRSTSSIEMMARASSYLEGKK